MVKIWERDISIDLSQVEFEVERRNKKKNGGSNSLLEKNDEERPTDQIDLPPIWGAGWQPSKPLNFSQKLISSEAKKELLRFIAERHDGYLEIISKIWEELMPPHSFDGESFHSFSIEINLAINNGIKELLLTPEFAELSDSEIIPRRKGDLYLERRTIRLLRDISLCMRRMAYTTAITLEDRIQWQRWMTRTRALDGHLKDLFINGVDTPDGSNFGGKGFRSTWQEGVVACATSMTKAIDLSKDECHRQSNISNHWCNNIGKMAFILR
jgi:hypothetical protein